MKTLPTRLHPLLAIAAIAVIIFSVAGVAAIFGKIPGAESRSGEPFARNTNALPSPSRPLPVEPEHASRNARGQIQAQAPVPAPCADCGVIESIRVAEVKRQG